MEKRRMSVNKINLNVHHYKNNGEGIIFLHFGTGNIFAWSGMIPYFTDDYEVIAVDIRGHGQSEKPLKGYSIENMGDDIIDVMDKLGMNQGHIIGSSLGGEIASSMASRYPERVKSIVWDGVPQNPFGENGVYSISEETISSKKSDLRRERKSRVEPIYDTAEDMYEKEKGKYESYGVEWNQWWENLLNNDIVKKKEGKFTKSCPKWVMDDYMEYYWDIKFENYYKAIQCPVLFVLDDAAIDDKKAMRSLNRIRDFLDNSKMIHIKEAFHPFISLQKPELFSREVLKFYKGLK